MESPGIITFASNYVYTSLKEPNEIRLLSLQPRSSGDKIRCTIKTARISDEPSYEALSYMWGGEDDQKLIAIDESDFFVRNNLWLALNQPRLESEVRVIWIDAICINQKNTTERNDQVMQMAAIYMHAERVIAWIGVEKDDSNIAMDFITKTGHNDAFGVLFTGPLQDASDRQKAAVDALFRRQYWNRLWIIQEIALSISALVQCGPRSLDIQVLWKFLSRLRNLSKTLPDEWYKLCSSMPAHL
jgi:hypothetical protein